MTDRAVRPALLPYPPRVALARTPTPLERLAATGDQLGIELHVKRDDLTGAELSGNKVRKLEFLLADALERGADTVVTCGGAQSNHCRATALAAARLRLASVLLLRTPDPASPPPTDGNILLDRLAGAEIRWISRAEYAAREEAFAREVERLRAHGRRPYVIPEGGSNAIGSWGYIAAAEELAHDLAALPPRPTTIVYAAGSGGTGAGLVAGARMTGLTERGVRVAGVNVCDDRDYFVRTIGRICGELAERWPGVAPKIAPADIDIVDGYVGDGYAMSRPEELVLLRDLCRDEGLVLDPVYTGKAFYGLTRELARDRTRFGERVVFLHTGGIFGLFATAEEIAAVL
jgi:D-cysteine desulfhydrase